MNETFTFSPSIESSLNLSKVVYTTSNLNDHWALLIFRMFIAVISIIGNFLILYISIRYKDFRKSNSNCLIALLSIGDICLGFGLFIRGLYSVQIIVQDIFIYSTTFCLWISLPQTQLWLSAIIGLICPTTIFYFSITSDLHSQISQCAIGSATKLFDKISSIYAFINAAIVIFFYSLALFFLHKRMSRVGSNGTNIETIIKTEKRVFTYVTFILALYLVLCIFPVVSLLILQSLNVPIAIIGYFSVFAGLGSGINSCIGIFVYLRKHGELKKHLGNILPKWIFKTLSGKDSLTSTKVVFIQSSFTHH
uniref:G-protein coupled receptors family 1 profile domain-containing protein n=1 Tax=Panagrolaimus sp. PS1159 TaxID=55785 RepID=A0AC35FPG9_9BILA